MPATMTAADSGHHDRTPLKLLTPGPAFRGTGLEVRARGAYFDGAQFTGLASFAGAQFTGLASFARAQFHSGASFDGAQFTGVAYFASVQFTRVTLGGARFTGRNRFDGVLETVWPPGWTTRPAQPDNGEDPAAQYLVRSEDPAG